MKRRCVAVSRIGVGVLLHLATMALVLQHTLGNFSDTNGSEQVDWSHLQPDLLYLISRKLTDICDFVRFRVVCKRWRFGVKSSELAPQLPWIIGESSSFGKGHLSFYSLLTNKTHIVNVPQTWGKVAIKSACNRIIIYAWPRDRYSLFNPLTKEEHSLPKLPEEIREFPHVTPPHLDQCSGCVCVCLAESKKPHSTRYLFYCRLGDPKWTKIYIDDLSPTKPPKIILGSIYNASVALYNGMCYINDKETGSTKVIDLANGTMTYLLPRPETELRRLVVYLVVSFGDILRVCWYDRCRREGPCYFVIYRLDLGNSTKPPCWIKINSITDQMLFLHGNRGCASRANDFPGFVGNCIYFTKFEYVKENYELSRYDMKDGKIEVLHVPTKLGSNWFVPSLCQ